ncbi:hypothetical protein BO94DRAFT_152292 [Aspergillus sclerotioniger CBS 115572]|uniref:Uncharacterized protein n=1 Tax=Aspergillus sclerotioniger CBS 115572 TaxID=1450535 RepID=A0A317W5L8_9EURO|nr:hypothetical protein BO94DRAFT_152292 [Aspergillus sclerotioniger CBS 115572]PWY80911.1 hypothetical protein BO94DRAFT_152292 [Aspergillus sclerotioniger CBS 115572]
MPVPTGLTLESLPVEIIQEIFLHCLEVNLPLASLKFARALSNPVLYTWVIRSVFSSTNKSSRHDIFTPDFLPAPLDPFSISPEERRDLQNIILNCRWCTLPLMRRCQRDYVEHAIRRKCRGLDFAPSDQEILANIGSRFENIDINQDECHGYRGKGELILKGKVRQSNADCKVALWFNFGALQIRAASDIHTEIDIFQLPSFTVNLPVRVPDKILRPPWTESKLEFLQLLSSDAYLDDEADHPRAKRLLRQVIRHRDLTTFQRLLNMSIRVPWYKYPIRWPVLPIHFYIALKYADELDDPFVNLLVNQRWDDIPDDLQLKDDLMSKAGPSSSK